MRARPVRTTLATIFSLFLSMTLGSECLADSWDVYFCSNTTEPCACPKGSLPTEQVFDLQSIAFEITGKTLRCVAGSNLIDSISKDSLTKTALANTPPCEPQPSTARPLTLNGKTPPISQEQLRLPTVAILPSMFPQGCGYAWKAFKPAEFRNALSELIKKDRISCSKRNHVNCSSASFMVFLSALRKLREQGRMTDAQIAKWSDLNEAPWKFFNFLARPDLLMTELKDTHGKPLGESKVLHEHEIGSTPGWPRPGDFVQFWREDLSGHSVIFQGFLKDHGGNTIGICYWSGNYSTDGFGYRCERMDRIKTMLIGRLDLGKDSFQ